MVKPPSGSTLGLAMKCLGSVLLPQVKSEPGAVATEGTRIHAVLEKYFKAGRVCPEEATEEDRKTCELVARAVGGMPEGGESSELAVFVQAVDGVFRTATQRVDQWTMVGVGPGWRNELQDMAASDTGLSVGSDGSLHGPGNLRDHEAYVSLRHRSFVAVADYVGLQSERHVAIWDWKSSGWVPEAKYNWQLLLPAIGLWLAAGSPGDFRADCGILYLDKLSSVGSDLRDATSTATFDSNAIAKSLRQLRFLEQSLACDPDKVALNEGKHCFFCPAAARCPAKIGTLGNALIDLGLEVNDFALVKNYLALSETWTSKSAQAALERAGGVMDLGDGREAVLTVPPAKRKIYTRKTHAKQARPDAPEDDKS